MPSPAFVMAKKKTKILKAGASTELPAFLHPTFMFVGEEFSDSEAESTKLLAKMMQAMGVKSENALVTGQASDPTFLRDQINSQKPKIVIALGATAAKNLLQTNVPIEELRGKIHDCQGTKLVATFHPAFLLKNAAAKKECWDDLQFAMREIGWKK